MNWYKQTKEQNGPSNLVVLLGFAQARTKLRFRSGLRLSSLREAPLTEHNGPTSASRTLDPCTKPPHLGGIAPEAPSTKGREGTRSETETNIPIEGIVVARK